MRQKVLIVIIVLAVPIGVTLGFLFDKARKTSQHETSPTQNSTESKKLPSNTFNDYSDSSGFAFSYPDDVKVKSKNTDNNTYANLDLISSTATGSVTIQIVDTSIPTLDKWLAGRNIATSAAKKNVSLGTLTATELKQNNRITTVALDKGVLFTISVDPKDEFDYWVNVYNKILSTFSFSAPSSNISNSSVSSGDDVIFEGEETIE